MTLVYSPPPAQPPDAPSASSQTEEEKCTICEQLLRFDTGECYKLSTCGHIFHKVCIERALSASAECPACKLPCHLSDLRNYTTQLLLSTDNASQTGTMKKTRTCFRGKSRGALGSRPQTRSVGKNLLNIDTILDASPRRLDRSVEVSEPFSPGHQLQGGISQRFYNINPNSGPPQNRSGDVDYEYINQMIDNSVTRMLQNINLQTRDEAFNRGRPQRVTHRDILHLPAPAAAPPSQPTTSGNINNNRGSNLHNSPFHQSDYSSSVRPEKIPSIIRNWNIRFDGSKTGLTVDEFIYRISSMTTEQLSGNFEIICNNLAMLLYDKALHWYWRYHKKVDTIRWRDFCVALKCEFKDMRSNYDIREELRNRKMRPSESFETFYDSICLILDRLETPIAEAELVEILMGNLRPEIRHELLYVPVYSLAHLRKLVQMRENLLSNEFYGKNVVTKLHQSSHVTARRQVAEIAFKNESGDEAANAGQIDAVNQSMPPSKCWNCDQTGHFWDDCVQDRTIFCYGCGTKNVYKPQCTKCLNRKCASKNLQRPNTSANPT